MKKYKLELRKLTKLWAPSPQCGKQKKLSIEKKTQLYCSLVRSIMCYSMEVRNPSKSQLARLEAAQIRHLRKLLNSPAHITKETNTEVREKTNMASITSFLQAARLNFWRKQTLHRDEEVWAANWGELRNEPPQPPHTRRKAKQQNDELYNIRKDITEIFEANKWSKRKMDVDKNGTIEANAKMWRALSECSKTHITNLHSFTSKAEKTKEAKMGPEQERTLQCEQCAKKFYNNVALVTHRWKAHGTTTPIRQLFIQVNNGEEHKCFICNKVYKNRRAAKCHITQVCSKNMNEETKQEWVNKFHFYKAFNRMPS
jgi:hypothetical protein